MNSNNKRMIESIRGNISDIEKIVDNDTDYNILLKDIEVFIERKKIEIIKAAQL
jgi:hypothetical protein